MKPQKPADSFRLQFSQMLNMSQPLMRLSEKKNWHELTTLANMADSRLVLPQVYVQCK